MRGLWARDAAIIMPPSFVPGLKPGHPQPAAAGRMLVVASTLRATPGGAWTIGGEAVAADRPHVPAHATPRGDKRQTR